IVRTLKKDRVNLGLFHERGQFDRVLAGHGQRIEVLVGDLDIRVLAVLVGLGDFVHEDFVIVDWAPALLLEPTLAGLVQVVEGEIFAFRGAKELYRDADHPERDGAFPNWTRHDRAGEFSTSSHAPADVSPLQGTTDRLPGPATGRGCAGSPGA